MADGSTRDMVNAIPAKVGDPVSGNIIKPNADGSLNIGSVTGGNVTVISSLANATAADPTYTEGTLSPLSQDDSGHLRVRSALDISVIKDGTEDLTPQYAAFNAGSTGANVLIAPIPGKKIRVLGYMLTANANVNANFANSTSGALSGVLYLGAHTGVWAGFNPAGWFETAVGAGLNLVLSGSQDTGGHITYVAI